MVNLLDVKNVDVGRILHIAQAQMALPKATSSNEFQPRSLPLLRTQHPQSYDDKSRRSNCARIPTACIRVNGHPPPVVVMRARPMNAPFCWVGEVQNHIQEEH